VSLRITPHLTPTPNCLSISPWNEVIFPNSNFGQALSCILQARRCVPLDLVGTLIGSVADRVRSYHPITRDYFWLVSVHAPQATPHFKLWIPNPFPLFPLPNPNTCVTPQLPISAAISRPRRFCSSSSTRRTLLYPLSFRFVLRSLTAWPYRLSNGGAGYLWGGERLQTWPRYRPLSTA
jgi:hypothetical protein